MVAEEVWLLEGGAEEEGYAGSEEPGAIGRFRGELGLWNCGGDNDTLPGLEVGGRAGGATAMAGKVSEENWPSQRPTFSNIEEARNLELSTKNKNTYL